MPVSTKSESECLTPPAGLNKQRPDLRCCADLPLHFYMLALLLRSCWWGPLPSPLLFVPFFFSTNHCTPALLLSSLPYPLPPYPHNWETCAGLFMLFLWHFHPRSEAHSRRVGTGGEAGVTDELKSTQLALKLAPWRGSPLVSMAQHKSCFRRRAERQTTRA